MVENEQGLKAVLSFGAKSVHPAILEKTLVGREKNIQFLLDAVKSIVDFNNNQQILVIGQRGAGKTHLVRLVYQKSLPLIDKGKLIVAYFAEEEYGVSSYFDFLTRILYAFIRWNEKDRGELNQKLEDLQNSSQSFQENILEKIISSYLNGRPLLILAENLSDILEGMSRSEQGKLRAWLYKMERISFIATSQSIGDSFDREDRPFYGFFTLYYLKPLSFEQALDFLKILAVLDQRDDIIFHLENKGKAKVHAIYDLVKGNHRLLVTFYEFLKSDTLGKVSDQFIKTVNDLKPYYESFIRHLPPQQQKILRYIALARRPQQGSVISKMCFIDQRSTSKQISELVKKRLIEIIRDENDRRNKFYDIDEPLLRISIEVGEHREGITALFIDFLALFYDENELRQKHLHFADLVKHCDDVFQKEKLQYEVFAIERAISLKHESLPVVQIIDKVTGSVELENNEFKYEILEKRRADITGDEYNYLLSSFYMMDSRYSDAIQLFSKLSAAKSDLANIIYGLWGYALLKIANNSSKKDIKLLEASSEKFELASKLAAVDSFTLREWGNSLAEVGRLNDDTDAIVTAIDKISEAVSLEPANIQNYLDISKWQLHLALTKGLKGEAENALSNLTHAIQINKDNLIIYLIWGGGLSFFTEIGSDNVLNVDLFLQSIARLERNSRLNLWTGFSKLPHVKFLLLMAKLLIADTNTLGEKMSSILIDWIIAILSQEPRIRLEEIAEIGNLLSSITTIPEVTFLRMYLDVYAEYFHRNNLNAQYILPKEQRLFFERRIIGREEFSDLENPVING